MCLEVDIPVAEVSVWIKALTCDNLDLVPFYLLLESSVLEFSKNG